MSAVHAELSARGRGGRLALPGAATAAFAGPAAAVVLLGLARGGYYATAWSIATVAALGVGTIAALRAHAVRLGGAFLGLFAAFVAWIGVEAARPGAATHAMPELERATLYLAVVWAAAQLITGRHVGAAFAGVASGICALLLDGLAHVLLPVHITADAFEGRLLFLPLGYANACGVLAALAIVLALGATRARSTAAVGLVPLAVALALTQSRGAVVALATGIAVATWLHPQRRALVGRMIVALPLPLVAGAFAARSAVADPGVSASVVSRACVAVAAVTGATMLIQSVVAKRSVVAPRGAVAVPTAIAVAGSFAIAAVGLGNRTAYWHVAWEDVRAHPLLGSGAGTFAREWLAHRTTPAGVLNAHNLYLETLAELGPVGLALLAAALAVPLVAAARGRSPIGAVAAGAYSVFLVHAALDWDWQMPAVTVAGLLSGVAALRAASCPERPSRRALQPALVAAAAVALAAAAAGIGNAALAAATRDGASPGAVHAARIAERLQPWSAEPRRLLAELALARGDAPAARALLVAALRRDPHDAAAWYDLVVAGTGNERAAAVHRLALLDPLAVRRLSGRAGARGSPSPRATRRR